MKNALHTLLILTAVLVMISCAKMGNPDGGWYDETPPRIVSASPYDRDVNVNPKKVTILFDEYIKVDNPSENVIVSPPQMEQPEIKAAGKKIEVVLKDSLKPNTTYTIDFSDAISDNNENNPLGNYTHTFSTSDHIDTLEVAGTVVNAEDLEPIKGILVGLYADKEDSAFTTQPMLRVAKTNDLGHFSIRGVAPGTYRIYALQDMDNNFMFSQKSEIIAFSDEIIEPYCRPDTRPDTLWRDSLHIESITNEAYTHFFPDNIVLRAFTEVPNERNFLKSERKDSEKFTLFFTAGHEEIPSIKGLNFSADNAFITQASLRHDTITYWLRDTSLVNQDTLRMELSYHATDTLGNLVLTSDTIEVLSKVSYEKRHKEQMKKLEEWEKKQEKLKKRGEPYQEKMPLEPMKLTVNSSSSMSPDNNPSFTLPAPADRIDINKLHLYARQDTVWYKVPFEISPKYLASEDSSHATLKYEMIAEWELGTEYSLEGDSAAFTDIYGNVSNKFKNGLKVNDANEYASLFVNVSGEDGDIIVQLINNSDVVQKEARVVDGTAELYYLKPGKYYLRAFRDENGNGKWDTGEFDKALQPEKMYYYHQVIECKAKWDLTESWNLTARDFAHQKPAEITKQKSKKQKKEKNQNAIRAQKLGIEYNPRR